MSEIWPRCPRAAAFFEAQFRTFAAANPTISEIAARIMEGAGVDMRHLIDHWALPETPRLRAELTGCGLVETATEEGDTFWHHPQARLPRIRLAPESVASTRLALAVEDVTSFVEAHGLTTTVRHGRPDGRYEEAHCSLPTGVLAVIARRGYRGFHPDAAAKPEAQALAEIRQAFRHRNRSGSEAEVLQRAQRLAEQAVARICPGRATDEFFAAERVFYMSRNGAARRQYEQQQRLGLGWANHDHHTYRSSRAGFRALMRLWHTFGFMFRERFYAGAEAGWGAQILEHSDSRVVLFCDVDLAPEELDIDFASEDLPPREQLGTIGLWCALHGDSIGSAGLHHLEAEFDFVHAKALLESAGFGVMAPFTDLPMLRQAFTVAEGWPVVPERVHALRARGLITAEQAGQFLTQGAPGSHLEILQRWEGFKGFNKTGVSAIIRQTDART